MTELTEGVIHYRHGFGSLALTVRHGVIVECEPPREWPLGREAVDFWKYARTDLGVILRWNPDTGWRKN